MNQDGDDKVSGASAATRRDFLATTSSAAMAGGLALGYGTFVAWAGRYLFPSGATPSWLFVSTTADLKPGDSITYESPTGVRVVVARRTESRDSAQVSADDFISLSSVCPHLGCRVHWEAQNKRFFCPCHNGEFDADGKATGGPPAVNHQVLQRYELLVENGLIFIQMPTASVIDHRSDGPSRLARAEESIDGDLALDDGIGAAGCVAGAAHGANAPPTRATGRPTKPAVTRAASISREIA